MPTTATAPLLFPGHVIALDSQDEPDVLAIQHRLNELGVNVDVNGEFDRATAEAVKLFQARSTDLDGTPLEVDGIVGPLTWAALFGPESVSGLIRPSSPLLAAVLEFAATQIGVMEDPLGSNRGPEVDEYIRSVGLDPAGHFAWCVAFMFFCFENAASRLGRANPMVKTAGVIDHWNKARTRGIPRITASEAEQTPSLVKPGHIFVIRTSAIHGHSGFIERVNGGKLVTIEGNTNEGGGREGIGVFRRTARKIVSINKGFIDYNGV